MRRTVIGLLSLCLCFSSIQAQEDTLRTTRQVMRATLYGIGVTNLLDTYLSPMEYTGPELRILRENMRMTKYMNGKVSRQSLFQANVSLTENRAGTGSEFAFLANWNLAYHYQFPINEHLKLMAGPNLDLNGGMIYNFRNSNNPVNAKAYANIGASGMAIYHFYIKEHPFVLRYQLNLPLLGIMFSPEYGQPYYEMSLSHNWGKNICFTALHNQPSIRQFLTLDFPIKTTNLRVGYICDIQQAKVNHLKSHTWSHAFMVGLVKHFQLVNPYK
ncbi:MAG: DUF3316 domain-containing protein [Bacteroides sp.]|nr:DUF3316 domain-containing protein [Bacteroides sp.]